MATSREAATTDETVRKRKAHRKSRSGCANCKLRRVKCDEGFPECRECLSYGVCCNYDTRIPDLQPRYASSRKLSGKMQTYSATLMMDLSSTEESQLELAGGNFSRLQSFRIRTAMSLGPPELRNIYENEVYRLTLRHPFLMHFVQALTSIHDRYLLLAKDLNTTFSSNIAPTSDPDFPLESVITLTSVDSSPLPGRRTIEEIHHWTKGVTLFNKKLSTPLHPADRDAIWAAGSLLGVITFASIEVPTLEETWPLAPSVMAEPEWLKMGQGKSVLMALVQPDRPESIFHRLFSTFPTIELSLQNVPSSFIKLYELDALAATSSPYTIPIISVFAPLSMERTSSLIALFYAFNSCMQNEFGCLVVNKDPRALLLMAYWYSKICMGQWWLRRRALMEGRATCMYLERYCTHDPTIQDLLKAPQSVLFNKDL